MATTAFMQACSPLPPSCSLPSLKARLASGQRLYGAFLNSFSPPMAEILGWAGYDYVVVDMEHGPGDTFSALPCLRALAATNTPSILRIAANDPVLAKKALDLGPSGIMIPMIENAQEASRAVASCRYPPRGIRGAAHPIIRASKFGMDGNYLKKCEEDLLIMLQIESKQAVERIPEIAAVEGVDCLMMGPADVSSSIGLLQDPGHEEVKALLYKAEEKILSARVYLGGFAMPDDPPQELHKRGYHMVAGTVDVVLFRNAALADIKANKPKSASS